MTGEAHAGAIDDREPGDEHGVLTTSISCPNYNRIAIDVPFSSLGSFLRRHIRHENKLNRLLPMCVHIYRCASIMHSFSHVCNVVTPLSKASAEQKGHVQFELMK
jgi:hypothetical protein